MLYVIVLCKNTFVSTGVEAEPAHVIKAALTPLCHIAYVRSVGSLALLVMSAFSVNCYLKILVTVILFLKFLS